MCICIYGGVTFLLLAGLSPHGALHPTFSKKGGARPSEGAPAPHMVLRIFPHRQCGGCKIFGCHLPSFLPSSLPSSSASPSATFFARALHPIGGQYSQQLL